MKLKTVRIQRSRPSAPALALALMLTMLSVYLISLTALPQDPAEAANAGAYGSADVRMEGLNTHFICEVRCTDPLEARLLAARCAQNGGAGLVLMDGESYAVIREACVSAPEQADVIFRTSEGLTLNLSGPAGEIAAVSDSVSFLYTQAVETSALAVSLESGNADQISIASLLNVYRTRGKRAMDSLHKIQTQSSVSILLSNALKAAVERLDAAIAEPDPGKLRLIHTAACADWIGLLESFTNESD